MASINGLGERFELDKSFHGWAIEWLGLRYAPSAGGGAYQHGYLCYIAAAHPGMKRTVLAIARPNDMPYIHEYSEGAIIPRVGGDIWSAENLSHIGPGRWDLTKHHIAAPIGWLTPMADAYEALQVYILSGEKQQVAVRIMNDRAARGVWGETMLSSQMRSVVFVGRDIQFQRMVDRHGSPSRHCAWAACMNGANNCGRSNGLTYIRTFAEAESCGACCPCTCGVDAKAMAEQMLNRPGISAKGQEYVCALMPGLAGPYREAVQLGRKKPLQYANPVDLDWIREYGTKETFGNLAGYWGDTGARWEPAQPQRSYVPSALRFGCPPVFQYQEVA